MTHMPGEAATTHQSPATRISSLLVVDDTSMNRMMLSRYISKLGYQAPLVEIDQERRAREVADISESDCFKQLPGKADELRNPARADQEDDMQEKTASEPNGSM